MRANLHTLKGSFNWKCLFGHAWGKWSDPILRTAVAGGFLGGEFIWSQRKCGRCGAMQGEETKVN